MSFLQWNDSYKLGVPAMDEQHKEWLAILNRFYDHLTREDNSENLIHLLDEAIAYTNYHFSQEEAYMQGIGYPKLTDQHERHEKIKQFLQEQRKKMEAHRVVISMPVTSEMRTWFSDHILKEDKGYADFPHR